jgi:hypothetical protein
MKKVNVLGTTYTIKEANERTDPKLKECDGYCDDTIKLCVVQDLKEKDLMSKSRLDEYKKKVIRHELVHAFLFESGLGENSDWASNEEAVDWIASQFPKMFKAFEQVQCL